MRKANMRNKGNISIQFLGAVGTVTGSKHLLKTPEGNILIDCGLFQGLKNLRLKNRESLPIEMSELKHVIITHAHLDHCGYLPVLIKNGFEGKIWMTPPTKDLVEIILKDSAKIQEEEAEKANEGNYSIHEPATPLYTLKDVEKTLSYCFTQNDNSEIRLFPQTSFEFTKNGHILGACFLTINCLGKRIVFSGDIGRPNSELLECPNKPRFADYLIMESTYGDRVHPHSDIQTELEKTINETYAKNGILMIPSFAVGRAQEIMFHINQLKRQNKIPYLPVYLDSPMGADATRIFINHPKWHKLKSHTEDILTKDVHIIRDYKDTLEIMADKSPKIIIAASGMVTGGRILNYLGTYGDNPNNTILLVGYQGEGTRGRSLKEGALSLKFYGEYHAILAEVQSTDCLSAHADQSEMIGWLSELETKPKYTFLVHGERHAQEIFRVKIQDELNFKVVLPEMEEEFILD
jgi:metallo-beta-lactamase family protein